MTIGRTFAFSITSLLSSFLSSPLSESLGLSSWSFVSFVVKVCLWQSQQFRGRLQSHSQPSRCLAINPAINQRLGHHCQRHLDRIEIHEDVRHVKLRLATCPHAARDLSQHHHQLQLPSQCQRLLSRMRVTDVAVFLCRGLALFAIPAKHLAPPVIGLSCLRHPRHHRILTALDYVGHFRHKVKSFSLFNYQITNFPNYQIFLPHPMASIIIPKGLYRSPK
jgi:hypothetical protein